jgi:hypothetical protein
MTKASDDENILFAPFPPILEYNPGTAIKLMKDDFELSVSSKDRQT